VLDFKQKLGGPWDHIRRPLDLLYDPGGVELVAWIPLVLGGFAGLGSGLETLGPFCMFCGGRAT
jgi:hypothetical protein